MVINNKYLIFMREVIRQHTAKYAVKWLIRRHRMTSRSKHSNWHKGVTEIKMKKHVWSKRYPSSYVRRAATRCCIGNRRQCEVISNRFRLSSEFKWKEIKFTHWTESCCLWMNLPLIKHYPETSWKLISFLEYGGNWLPKLAIN